MLTPEDRAVVADLGDRLLDLYARRDDAIREGNLERLNSLQTEITDLSGNPPMGTVLL
jgi:hypothetical protein